MAIGLKARFELAAGVIGLAGDLGLPVDVFGGLFGGGPTPTDIKLAELRADIAELQASVDRGFFQAAQEDIFRTIQTAVSSSERAAASLNNIAATDEAKATALTDARGGLTDISVAIQTVLDSSTIELTPRIVEEMYTALAFSLSVQINAAAELLYGESLNGVTGHGGFLAVQTQIDSAIDVLSALEPAITAQHGFNFSDVGFVAEGGFGATDGFGRYNFSVSSDFGSTEAARAFYQNILREVLPLEDQDFSAANFVTEGLGTVYNFPRILVTDRVAEFEKYFGYLEEIKRVAPDLAFSNMTGLQVTPHPFQTGSYSWNTDAGSNAFDDLITSTDDTVDGRVRIASGNEGADLSGTLSEGDYLRGSSGNDTLRGFGGDDYLQGGGRNDIMFGGDGNDRYFGGRGSDAMIDNGASTDVDVAVFEGFFEEYSFFDDTGTTGPRIIMTRVGFDDTETLRGIEFLKFDDSEVAFSDLILSPRDLTAPDAPLITGISQDTGVSASDGLTSDGALVISGTAEANSFVTISMDGPTVGSAQADGDGAWSFDFGATTDLNNGDYSFSAFATDTANNTSLSSGDFLVTIDKTAIPLKRAEITSTAAEGVPARPGDTITVGFELFASDQVLGATPVVTLAGVSAVVVPGIGLNFSAQVTLNDTAVAGDVTFEITLVDLAGNISTTTATTDGSGVTIITPDVLPEFNEIDGGNSGNVLSGTAGNDLMRGFKGDDDLRGRDGDDVLQGNNGNDDLKGGSGSDSLNGGNGKDDLAGGRNTDALLGGAGADRLDGGSGADDLRGGTGGDVLKGGKGRDALYGDAGADRLFGQGSDDLLTGGAGDDFLKGGAGADVFVFDVGHDQDVIADFSTSDGLEISIALANSQNAQQIADGAQSDGNGGLIISFGAGDQLILSGFDNIAGLAGQIEII